MNAPHPSRTHLDQLEVPLDGCISQNVWHQLHDHRQHGIWGQPGHTRTQTGPEDGNIIQQPHQCIDPEEHTINALVATNAMLTKTTAGLQTALARMYPPSTAPHGHSCPTHCSCNITQQQMHLLSPLEPNQTPWDKTGYCWSHGFKVKESHNSNTCTSCNTGHQPGATHANTMGSSTYNTGYPFPPNTPT